MSSVRLDEWDVTSMPARMSVWQRLRVKAAVSEAISWSLACIVAGMPTLWDDMVSERQMKVDWKRCDL